MIVPRFVAGDYLCKPCTAHLTLTQDWYKHWYRTRVDTPSTGGLVSSMSPQRDSGKRPATRVLTHGGEPSRFASKPARECSSQEHPQGLKQGERPHRGPGNSKTQGLDRLRKTWKSLHQNEAATQDREIFPELLARDLSHRNQPLVGAVGYKGWA